MQCGAGARPEWAGKRLVALKRMKRVWHGGWREARTLGELTVSVAVHKLLTLVFARYSIAPRRHSIAGRVHFPTVPGALLCL